MCSKINRRYLFLFFSLADRTIRGFVELESWKRDRECYLQYVTLRHDDIVIVRVFCNFPLTFETRAPPAILGNLIGVNPFPDILGGALCASRYIYKFHSV